MRRPARVASLLLAASLCAFAGTAAHAARIGVLSNKYAVETAADFNVRIPGHTFVAVDTRGAVPSVSSLTSQFDAVLLFEDSTFVEAPGVGAAVAAFARSGRAVVLGTFYEQDRSDSAAEFTPHGWGDLETIDPNTTDGVGTTYALRTLGATVNHPLTAGVNSLFANKFAGGNRAKPATIVAAYWAQKNAKGEPDPAVDYRITGAACVIHVAMAPNYAIVGVLNTDFGGDFYRLWHNTFDFAAGHCVTGTGQIFASDAIAIPASSWPALALAAALLAALGGRRLARRRTR